VDKERLMLTKEEEAKIDQILKYVDSIANMAGAREEDPVILELERERMLGNIDPETADFMIYKRIKEISAEETARDKAKKK
jgi:hypothetical protein